MSAEGHENAAAMRHHWWYRGRAVVVTSVLRRARPSAGNVLDYGCGTGHMGPTLARFGTVYGVDVAEALKVGTYAGYAWVGLPEQLDASLRFGVIACLDVLEHVADDRALLHELAGLLAPGGMLVVSVPMRPDLFCEIDEVSGHFRRYAPADLATLFTSAGLHPIAKTGYVVTLLPVATAHRKRIMRGDASASTEFTTPARPVNAVLSGIACAEGALARYVSLPPGLSQITVLRRADR
jgi:2-polyprenyl-3-methyl-5-hydroxy-6-metoxy-1,4-benzoquinol methylase